MEVRSQSISRTRAYMVLENWDPDGPGCRNVISVSEEIHALQVAGYEETGKQVNPDIRSSDGIGAAAILMPSRLDAQLPRWFVPKH